MDLLKNLYFISEEFKNELDEALIHLLIILSNVQQIFKEICCDAS